MFKFRLSVLPLLFANLLPIIGVVYWGWSLTLLLIIYWLEGLIVGFFTLVKMVFSNGTGREKIANMAFFCIHYGLFWVAHGVFLAVFVLPIITQNPEIGGRAINTGFNASLKWLLLSLFTSHFLSFVLNFLRQPQARNLPPHVIMWLPYGRVVVMHILIITSALLAAKFGGSPAVLFAFITLKITADILSHAATNNIYARNGQRRLLVKN